MRQESIMKLSQKNHKGLGYKIYIILFKHTKNTSRILQNARIEANECGQCDKNDHKKNDRGRKRSRFLFF